MADAALLLLGQLCSAGVTTMKEAGWHIGEDDRGRPLHVHPESGQSQQEPPDLSNVIVNEDGVPVLSAEDQWGLSLLLELTTLISPYVTTRQMLGDESPETKDEPVLVWPATVRYYQPEVTDPAKPAISIIDIVKDDDNETVTTTEGKTVPLQVTSRHLIVGSWHGLTNGLSETEVDLGFAPGTHLESWVTCTMAGLGFLSTRKAGRGKLLLLGLGGGSIATFSGKYWPGVSIEAIESNTAVVRLAEEYFGVTCDPPVSGSAFIHNAEHLEFTPDPNSRPTRVRVTTAEKFVKATLSDPECRYDGILVDLTTSGEFPPLLLNKEFFSSLLGLQKDISSGCIAVSVQSKGDRHAIVNTMKQVFATVKVLTDPNYDDDDEDYEPSVVLGFSKDSKFKLTKEEWVSRAKTMKEEWEDSAPLMPFELENVFVVDEEEMKVSWGGNSLLVGDGVGGEGESKPIPELMDKSDPAFGLFD
jgi:hypothetical protein